MIWKNRILRAYGTSLLGVFSGLLTNLWLLREITRHVSVTDLGLYGFVLQITSYLNILQLGLDFAASRQIAESLGRGESAEANRAYWELWRVNRVSTAAVFVGVVALTAAFWSGVAKFQGGSTQLAARIAFIAGTAQAIGFLSRPYSAALIGNQHLPLVNLLTALRTIVTTLLAYFILVGGFGVLSVPTAEVVTQVGGLAVLAFFAASYCRWRSGHRSATDPHLRRSILRFGGVSTLGGFAWTVEGTSDVMILGWFAGPAAVATYVLWWRFPQMLFDLCTRLAFSAFPGFAQRHGQSPSASRLLFSKVSVVTAGLATVALIGISFWLPSFVMHWVGPRFVVANPHALAFLMGLLICLRTWGNLLAMFWMATGRAELTTISSWAQAGVKVALGLLLVRNYGITGLIAASCASASLQIVIVGTALLKENLIDRASFAKNAAFTVAAVALAFSAMQFPAETSLLYLLAGIAATAAGWGLIWFAYAWRTELAPVFVPVMNGIVQRLRLA